MMILSLEKLRKDYKLFRKKDEEIAARINILIELSKLELKASGYGADDIINPSKKLDILAFLKSMKVTERTIQRWKKDYTDRGAEGLGKLKATGRPPVAIRRRIQRIIEAYRKMYRWGSEVIQAHLLLDHDYKVSRFKVDKFLTDSGLKEEYPCTTAKKQRASKKKKHTKVVVVDNPGAHTQMDVKYQIHLLTCKDKCYVYNFIDHASNWSFKYAYPAINARNTEDFMKRVIAECPFWIFRLQTDNGVEFTNKYISVSDDPKEHLLDKFCAKYNIIHKLIPPGEKELQGLVERSHRQDDQELFSRINPHVLNDFRSSLTKYAGQRNRLRRFKKLGWKTPDEWLTNYQIVSIAALFIYHSQQNCYSNLARTSGEIIDITSTNNPNKIRGQNNEELAHDILKNDEKKVKLAA
jgi:transposase